MADDPEQMSKPQKQKRKPNKASSRAPEKIDVIKTISAPVQVTKGGEAQSMPAFEARLRAQIRKATVEKSLKALLHVLDVAEKYDMLVPAPEPPRQGGVLIVPGRLTQEEWEGLWPRKSSTAESEIGEKESTP